MIFNTRTALVLLLTAAVTGCGTMRRPRPVLDTTEDPRIQREVEARLALEPALDGNLVRVTVRGGVVSLYGIVAGMGSLRCALVTAQLVDGVRTVVDQLELLPGPREAACRAGAGRGIVGGG